MNTTDATALHAADFIDAVRTRKPSRRRYRSRLPLDNRPPAWQHRLRHRQKTPLEFRQGRIRRRLRRQPAARQSEPEKTMDLDLGISRRTFMQTAALAAASTSVASASPPPAPADGEWFDRPMRWAQLTLVEDDPGKYDLNFWLDYFRRTHSDAACLSAGGCVAYYPTKVPLHYRSQWLGDTRSVRRTGGGLPQAEHGGDRAHRSARRAPGRLRRASRLDRRRCRGQQAPPSGRCRNSGSPARWVRTISSS